MCLKLLMLLCNFCNEVWLVLSECAIFFFLAILSFLNLNFQRGILFCSLFLNFNKLLINFSNLSFKLLNVLFNIFDLIFHLIIFIWLKSLNSFDGRWVFFFFRFALFIKIDVLLNLNQFDFLRFCWMHYNFEFFWWRWRLIK